MLLSIRAISGKLPIRVRQPMRVAAWMSCAIAVFFLFRGATEPPTEGLYLIAGSTPSSAPVTFLDIKTRQIVGIMPDVASEIARRNGWHIDYQGLLFSALVPSAVAGKIDMIAANMAPTPQREKVLSFSQMVAAFPEAIIVRDDNPRSYRSVHDFAGEVIGILAGTDYAEAVRQMNVAREIKLYDNNANLARDVELGRIALGMSDYPALRYQEQIGALPGLHVVEAYQSILPPAPMAFAVPKDNVALLERIDVALSAMKEDGTLLAILRKWKMEPSQR